MSNFKKIVSVILSLTLVFSFCLSANATGPATTVDLSSSYDNSGQYLQITMSTAAVEAGIMGTLTYDPSVVKFVPGITEFCSEDNTAADSLNCSANSVRFVIAGDVVNGTTKWATFSFEVLKTANAAFVLSDVSVCDVNEIDVYTTINNKSINVSAKALATLGAQIRQDTSTSTIHDIRFGSKLVRNVVETGEYIVVDGNSYKAKSCGYLVALTSKIDDSVPMTVDSTDTDVKNKQSTKCYLRLDTYFIYTVVVTGITDANKGTKISVRPYVVYEIGGVNHYSYGDQVSKCVNDVAADAYK